MKRAFCVFGFVSIHNQLHQHRHDPYKDKTTNLSKELYGQHL